MVNLYKNFSKAFCVERIKIKNTGTLITAIILAVMIPIIVTGFMLYNLKSFQEELKTPVSIFESLFDSCISGTLGFSLPILLIITAARVVQIEFKNNTFQLMETQPLHKFAIYFGKFAVILYLYFISLICFFAVHALCSTLIYAAATDTENLTLAYDFSGNALLFLKIFLGSLFVTTIIYVFSIKFSNFIISILIGFALLMAKPILEMLGKLPKWYPFKLLTNAKEASDFGYWITYSEVLSVLASAILLYIGYQWYSKKSFKNAFLNSTKKIVTTILILGGLFALFFWVLSPKQTLSSDKTRIKGTFTSENKSDRVYLIDAIVSDTIAQTTVKDAAFDMIITQDLPLGTYLLRFDDTFQKEIIMGKNDLVELEVHIEGGELKAKVNGSRLAENNTITSVNFMPSVAFFIDEMSFKDNTQLLEDRFTTEYNDEIKNISSSYTTDNYVPRQDFMDLKKKELTVKFLNLYTAYQEKYKLYYPDKEQPNFKIIKELKEKVGFSERNLLSNAEYSKYFKAAIIAKDTSAVDENTKYIQAINKLPATDFKERLLAIQSNTMLREANSSAQMDTIYGVYKNLIQSEKYQKFLKSNYENYKRLSKGTSAPSIDATDASGKKYQLEDFKGSYVLIDVWATWCGPCKQESPKFEQYANNNKKANIKFVALSIDKKIDDWLIDVKNKKSKVLQLHADNYKAFTSAYQIMGIPRFMLIGPEGNIININLPQPSDANFEEILNSAIK